MVASYDLQPGNRTGLARARTQTVQRSNTYNREKPAGNRQRLSINKCNKRRAAMKFGRQWKTFNTRRQQPLHQRLNNTQNHLLYNCHFNKPNHQQLHFRVSQFPSHLLHLFRKRTSAESSKDFLPATHSFCHPTNSIIFLILHQISHTHTHIQSHIGVHHYRCIAVALYLINIRQKGRLSAASLAAGSSMPNEDRSLQTSRIEVERGLPGGLTPGRPRSTWFQNVRSSPVIRMLHKQNSIGISQLIHSSDMSKHGVSKTRHSRGLSFLLTTS